MNEMTDVSSADVPLYVDLDGTLIRSDILIESLFALIKARPLVVFLLPLWLLRGRANFKAEIAKRITIDPALLVYNERVVAMLRADRKRGRRIVLATASHRLYGEAIARHLDLFDHVLGTDETVNLKSGAKLAAIERDADGRRFDYAGNEAADLPIWRHARKAIVVEASPAVTRKARALTATEELPREKQSVLKLVIKAIRVHQWLKNVLVFLPLVTAHRIEDVTSVAQAVGAFFAFGLCASSVYLLNDLSDLQSDRLHPRKRTRPFASGALPLTLGVALIPLLLTASLAISLAFLPLAFLGVLGVYYLSSLTYNFVAKDRAIWDVVILAGLYALRVLAGAAATGIPPSFWLLAFSMFIFLSLALVKRYSEMVTMHKQGKSEAHGRGYVTDDMPVLQAMGVASGFLAVLVMALYINSPEVGQQYARPYALWPICPLILFWVSRIWLKTHRGQMHDDPVIFAARDRLSLMIGAACVAAILLGLPR